MMGGRETKTVMLTGIPRWGILVKGAVSHVFVL